MELVYGITVFIWWVSLFYITIFIVAYKLMAGDEKITPTWLNWLVVILLVAASVLLLLKF